MLSTSSKSSGKAPTEVYLSFYSGLQGNARWNQNVMRREGPLKETKYSPSYSVDQDEYLKSALFS